MALYQCYKKCRALGFSCDVLYIFFNLFFFHLPVSCYFTVGSPIFFILNLVCSILSVGTVLFLARVYVKVASGLRSRMLPRMS